MIGAAEKKAVMDVLKGPILVHGPLVKEFEAAFALYAKAAHAVAVSSCTAGLHLAYFHLGIKPGDEVVVPAQTHTATAHAVELCGAKPVFVDAEPETGNIDIDQIEAALSARTKAISVVHYLGMPVNMEKIMKIAGRYNLAVIEDCALGVGSYFKGTHVGLFGDAGSFSFYPVKHMTTAEGGMLITRHKEWAEGIIRKRAFGVDRHMGERRVPGEYDVTMLGFNYRLNEIQAAIGIEQLKRVNAFLKKRKSNYAILQDKLSGIDEIKLFKSSHGDYQSSYYCFSVLLSERLAKKRLEIIYYLKERGVGTSIYYPRPVPHFTYYKQKYGYPENTFPVASRISKNSIAFPVGPHLNSADMVYIVKELKNAIKKVG